MTLGQLARFCGRASAWGGRHTVNADVSSKNDQFKISIQCLAMIIRNRHPAGHSDLVPELDSKLLCGRPGLLLSSVHEEIGVAAGVHGFADFAGKVSWGGATGGQTSGVGFRMHEARAERKQTGHEQRNYNNRSIATLMNDAVHWLKLSGNESRNKERLPHRAGVPKRMSRRFRHTYKQN